MSVAVVYSDRAVKALKRLERDTAQQIVKKLKFYVSQKDVLARAKKLKPPFDDLYRYRIGDYRAIFEINDKGVIALLTILGIKHRKDVYE